MRKASHFLGAFIIAALLTWSIFPVAPEIVSGLIGASVNQAPSVAYDAPYIVFSTSIAIGLFSLFLLTTVAAFGVETYNVSGMLRRLAALLEPQVQGEIIYPHDLLQAAKGQANLAAAEQFARTLRREDAIVGRDSQRAQYVSETPVANFFLGRDFVERPLFLDVTRALPTIFFGLSAFALVVGLLEGLTGGPAEATAVSVGLKTGLLAALVPLILGVVCWFLAETLSHRRMRQTEAICRSVEMLYPYVTPGRYLRQLTRKIMAAGGATPLTDWDELAETLEGALTRQFAKLEMTFKERDGESAKVIAEAIETGLAQPLGALTAATSDMARRIVERIDAVGHEALGQASAAYAEQVEALRAALGQLSDVSAALGERVESLAGGGAGVTDEEGRAQMTSGVETALQRLAGQLEDLERAIGAISGAPPGSDGGGVEAKIGELLSAIDRIGGEAIETTGRNLRATGAAVLELQSTIDQLEQSLVPALANLVETEQALLKVLEGAPKGPSRGEGGAEESIGNRVEALARRAEAGREEDKATIARRRPDAREVVDELRRLRRETERAASED